MSRLRQWQSSGGHAVELCDHSVYVPGAELAFTVRLDHLLAGAIARFTRKTKPWSCLVCGQKYQTKKLAVDHLDWTHYLHVRAVHAATTRR